MTNIAAPGLGSGLDVNGIVSQLVAVEQQPAAQRLDRREANLQARLSAFGVLKSAISSFQGSLGALSDPTLFQAKTAQSDTPTVASVSASNAAAEGSFALTVTQLAAAHSLVSDPALPAAQFTSSADVVGTGSLAFNFGTTTYDPGTDAYTAFVQNPDQGAQTVQIIDGSLSGIRDAVNAADIGVSASLVFDGSNERLVFTSTNSGAANSLQISVTDDDGDNDDSSGLSLFSFNATSNNLLQTQDAQDAQATLNGIAVTSASNSLSENLDGVTVNLLATGSSTLTVSKSGSTISTNINTFVEQYNNLVKTINDLSAFDPNTGVSGTLNGDGVLRTLDGQFRRILSNQVPGAPDGFSILADIGITRNAQDGTLVVDSTKLGAAINTNADAVTGLFAAFGTAADSLVDVTASTTSTVGGRYGINITQLATQGQVVGGSAATLTITAGVDDALTLSVDGTQTTVTLAAGTYTATSLVAELQSKINADSVLQDAALGVKASESGGVLTLISNSFGLASIVSIDGGTAAAGLFGVTPVATDGVDIAGTIGGLAATGSGQKLTGSGDASGLEITVNGGLLGDRGVIDFARGYADQLGSVLTDILGSNGVFSSVTDGLNAQIQDISGDREALARRITSLEARLRKQFGALDVLVSNLNATSSFLTSQLAALPTIGGNNR
ncbi:Flagellar hook-associated protein FliD [hydrothermal vent metagenome]|uniref:Filament cap protein n=1 Tax=hydrothermal vent metagenome TaxID=652676 RepID=A0A3B0Y1U7_9ZZZZ